MNKSYEQDIIEKIDAALSSAEAVLAYIKGGQQGPKPAQPRSLADALVDARAEILCLRAKAWWDIADKQPKESAVVECVAGGGMRFKQPQRVFCEDGLWMIDVDRGRFQEVLWLWRVPSPSRTTGGEG